MQYGFAIDQRTCIGCHACTVACKTEHEVPLGQFRTWVKYVDKGEYPSTTREFGVMRCNHCTDAPCVAICPTQSLFKRDDGIVDFDSDKCIGCKSCMQACPYDALYIDEDTHTAAKCNFCAHRIDQGLEPACVVVCPTESIWVGDLDDADSGIRRFLSIQPVQTRTPEQGTGPNVFYVGASEAVLDPLAAPVDDTYIWAAPDPQRAETRGDFAVDPVTRAKTTLNTAHPRAWGWKVWTYLWTKSVAAGAVLIAAFLLIVDQSPTTLTGDRGALAGRGVRGDDRRPAHRGPQAPGTVLLPVHQAQPDVLAGLGRRDPGRVRRGGRAVVPRRRVRGRRAGRGPGVAGGPGGGDDGGLHRVPVRSGRRS